MSTITDIRIATYRNGGVVVHGRRDNWFIWQVFYGYTREEAGELFKHYAAGHNAGQLITVFKPQEAQTS